MSQQEEQTQVSALNAQLKELTEENEALFEQLHVVQEELERYYHKLKEAEQNNVSAGSVACTHGDLPKVLAENQRLRTLAETQKNVLIVQRDNSLATRLGKMLIEGTSSTGSLLSLPGKLRRIWRAEEAKVAPAELGAKDFSKLIAAYEKGGLQAAEKLLDSVFISSSMRASAYTAVARCVMQRDAGKAAELAHRAYGVDPRPFRLKWLAFRVHEAGNAVSAEAMLDLLPADVSMSESEERQVMRIRHEAKQTCHQNVQKESGVAEHREAENKKIAQLSKNVEEQKREVERLARQSSELQKQADTHKREAEMLRSECTDLRQLTDTQRAEAGALKADMTKLQAEADEYKAENTTLRVRSDELQILADERKAEVDRLNVRHDELHKLYQEEIKLITAQQKELLSTIVSQDSVLALQFEKQGADLERVRKSVQQACKNEVENALQQTVAYAGLKDYYASGKLPQVTPWKRGWPASPDFILWLVELIENNDYDLILEFGSGVTTLYTAKTIAARESKGATAKSTHVLSFDHLEQFFQQTQDMLMQAGLGGRVNVMHAPLEEYTAPDGTSYQYYSCQDALKELSLQYKSGASRILVIVDGPPGDTNKNARYPAFPLVMKYFASAHIDFLLDDYIRGDEKELANHWQAACATAGIEYEVVTKALEKEALLLSIEPAYTR